MTQEKTRDTSYLEELTKDELIKIIELLSTDCERLRLEIDKLKGVIR